jgi:hypothetical protein
LHHCCRYDRTEAIREGSVAVEGDAFLLRQADAFLFRR